jgi:hypothetical protein
VPALIEDNERLEADGGVPMFQYNSATVKALRVKVVV